MVNDAGCTISETDDSLGIVFSGNTGSSTTGYTITGSSIITPLMLTSESNSLPIITPP